MDLIKADHHRTLRLAGVPDPVSRPVEIDPLQTGFASLRSLRIYRFSAGSIIDGHAESDEVCIVILAGSVALTLAANEVDEASPRSNVSAPTNQRGEPCAAYLPPGGAYRLVAQGDADVAYARASSSIGRAPMFFAAAGSGQNSSPEVLLFDASTYPVHLRLRVVEVSAAQGEYSMMPVASAEAGCEALVHVRTEPVQGALRLSLQGGEPMALHSWDTVSLLPGERPALHVAAAARAMLLIVLASA